MPIWWKTTEVYRANLPYADIGKSNIIIVPDPPLFCPQDLDPHLNCLLDPDPHSECGSVPRYRHISTVIMIDNVWLQCCGAGPFLTGSGFFLAGSGSCSSEKVGML